MMAIDTRERVTKADVQTFELHTKPAKLRLTNREATWVRYVLGEWESDGGAASSLGAQLQRLAQRPTHGKAEHPRPHWWEQTIFVPTTQPSVRELDWPQDRYCGKKRSERDSIHRAWRALGALSGTSLVTLNALYGGLPPGMHLLERGLWPKDVDEDYRRVCRVVVGSIAEFVASLRVNTSRRIDETKEAHKVRVAAANEARATRGREVGRECERAIVRASNEYRKAWDVVG